MNLRRLPLGLAVVGAILLAHFMAVTRAPAEPARGFVYDDESVILMNRENLSDWGTVGRFLSDPTTFNGTPGNPMFRPVAHASHVLDAHLWGWGEDGPPPRGWRLTNLLLHAATALVLYHLLRRILEGWNLGDPYGEARPSGAALAAFLGALWFGLQPVNSEVVNYVTARSESLAALFFLLALLAHHAAWREGASPARRAGLVLLSGACALLSFGSKETGLLLPAAAGAVELWGRAGDRPWRDRLRNGVLRALPLAAAAAICLLLRKAALGSAAVDLSARSAMAGAGIDPMVGGGRSLLAHLLTQSRVCMAYLLLLLFPVDLAPDHGVRVAADLDGPTVIALLVLAAGAGRVVREALRGKRALPLAAAWGAVALAPSVLVPLNVVMNEHRLYLPSTGLSLLAGIGLLAVLRSAHRSGHGASVAAGAGVIVLFCSFLVVDGVRARTWSDPYVLWLKATETSPGSWRNHMHLGVEYYRAGENAFRTAENSEDRVARAFGERMGEECMDLARTEFQASQALYPGAFETRLDLGFLHLLRGRWADRRTYPDDPPARPEEYREAIRWFTLAEQASPGSFRALYNRAGAMAAAGMVKEATAEFERLAQEKSRTTMYAFPLADLYRRAGRTDDALAQLDLILRVDPSEAGVVALKRAEALTAAKRFEEANAALKTAFDVLGPDNREVWVYMARMLVAIGGPTELEKARDFFGRATRLGYRPGPKDRDVLAALAAPR